MKKFLLIGFIVLATNAYAAKRVKVCHFSFTLTASKLLECTGDFEGKINIVELYKKGWSLIAVASTDTFIFEKQQKHRAAMTNPTPSVIAAQIHSLCHEFGKLIWQSAHLSLCYGNSLYCKQSLAIYFLTILFVFHLNIHIIQRSLSTP